MEYKTKTHTYYIIFIFIGKARKDDIKMIKHIICRQQIIEWSTIHPETS